MFQFLRSIRSASKARPGATRRSASRRRTLGFQPQLEQLEVRRLMTATPDAIVELASVAAIHSYAGVGLQQNEVATLSASVNGQPDTNLSDFSAQINWGNGKSAGDLVFTGINGSFAEYLIEGSHTYQQPTSNTPIVVFVNGPDGTSSSGQTTYAVVNADTLSLGKLSETQWDDNEAGYSGAIGVAGGAGAGAYRNLVVTGLPQGLTASLSGSKISITGTPTQTGVFSSGLFYKFVTDTLQGTSPIPANVNVNPSSATSFIEYFEGDYNYPYLDSSNIATIGVGINLTTVSGSLEHNLAQDVRAYYLSQYHQTLSSNDATVINMLIAQAKSRSKTPAFSAASDQALFQQTYQNFASIASGTLGATWSTLSTQQQVALVDLAFNMGSLSSFPAMTSALQQGDLLQASFQLVNAIRTTQAPGLTTRTEAEFQNLLAGNTSLLGKLI